MIPVRPQAASAGPRLLILSGSVGAGHDGAAHELARRLRAAGATAEVRDFLDAVPSWAAWILREGYLAASRHAPVIFELMFQGADRQRAALRGFRFLADLGAATVQSWVVDGGFDAVVSTYPVSSQCLGAVRASGRCPVPALTYITDPAVHRAWVHRSVDVHLTVTQVSADQGSREHGATMIAAGPLVPDQFARAPEDLAVERVRRELNLPGNRPVALLTAGSLGLGNVRRTAMDVAAAGFTGLVLCGRNTGLEGRLAGTPGVASVGWRDDVHVLLHAADVLVHNAGGLSFTEALVSGLPAVTYRPIPGHGRANAAILHASGLAPWARNAEELGRHLWAQLRCGRRPQLWKDPADAVLHVLQTRRRTSA